MGQPKFEWNEIPLSKKMDYKNLNIKISSKNGKEITGGFSLNVGNPHVIFFVEDYNNFNLNEIGPKIENHNYFPKKCNVTLASIKSRKYVKVKSLGTWLWFNNGLWNRSLCYSSGKCYSKIHRKRSKYRISKRTIKCELV